MPTDRRILGLAPALLVLLAACGGGSGPTANSTSAPTSGSGTATSRPTSAPPAATPKTGGDDDLGASLRIVNLYPGEDGKGEAVVLFPRTHENDGTPPLATVPFGQTAEDVKVPTKTSLQLFAANHLDRNHSQFVTPLYGFEDGERNTYVALANPTGSDLKMGGLRVAEIGPDAESFWPAVDPGKVDLLIYPGGLLSLPDSLQSWYYATTKGTCLVDASTGKPNEYGIGGNIPQHFLLDPGTTEIVGADSGCKGAAGIKAATIQAAAGDRVLAVPYGSGANDLTFLVLTIARS